jgi:hypothetical protein
VNESAGSNIVATNQNNGNDDVVVENDGGDEYVPLALPPGTVASAEEEITL